MENKIYSKVFGWLFFGLLLTFGTGFALTLYPDALKNLLNGPYLLIAIVLELVLAIFFSMRIRKMAKPTAVFCYLLYSFVTGLTFSVIFMSFQLETLLLVFGITAVVFGLFAFFGAVTKLPLNKLGSFLFIGLIGVILAGILNIFLNSSSFDFAICIIGVLIFVGYIAYDIKKLPVLFDQLGSDKGAIYGAFQLYLDFINLFIRLLRLFGGNGNKD